MRYRVARTACRWAGPLLLLMTAVAGTAAAATPSLHLSFDGHGADTASNVPVTWTYGENYVGGARGSAALFDGRDQAAGGSRLSLARHPNLFGMSQLTVAGWYKRQDAQADGMILWNHSRYGIGIDANRVVFHLTTSGGSAWETPAAAPTDTNWHHVALVYDGSRMRGYIDGKLIADRPMTGSVGGPASWDPMVGSNPWGSAFRGSIDEVMVYRSALAASELAALATPGTSSASTSLATSTAAVAPAVHFPLDGDLTAAAGSIKATTSGTVTWETGKISQAAQTSRGHIRLARNNVFFDTDKLTLALWAKKNSASTGGCAFWNHVRYGVEIGSANVAYTVYLPDEIVNVSIPANVTDSNWHHVAMTYDGSALRGYLDGKPILLRTGAYGKIQPAAYWDPQIGARSSTLFPGAVDDVRLYRSVLDAGQIAGLAGSTAPAPVNEAPTVDAGPAQEIALGETAFVAATASDDGRPGPLTYAWTQQSGPTSAVLSAPKSAQTEISLPDSGSYAFRVTVSDGEKSAYDDVVITVTAPANEAPTVDAGSDQTVAFGANVTLSATAKDDGLPQPLTYAWTQRSGPANATLATPAAASTEINLPESGSYTFRVTVSDGEKTAYDEVVVSVATAANTPPVVDAGADQTVTGLTANLSATLQDDGKTMPLWHMWFVSGGAGATVASPGAAQTTVTLPSAGVYSFMIFAWDGQYMGHDSVTITAGEQVVNQAPTVSAGSDQSVAYGATATLTATAQDDGQIKPLTYAWTQRSGPANATISGASTAKASVTFPASGSYLFRVTVSDGEKTAYDDVAVTVASEPVVNQAPTVNAGSDQSVAYGATATLTATAQDDGRIKPLTYAWTQRSGPANATISGASTAKASVSFPASGSYLFRVTVSDGEKTAYDEVAVTVASAPVANKAPTVDAGPAQTIAYGATATLTATAQDDGQIKPLTYSWRQTYGPGVTTFGSASAASTTAKFSLSGAYTLEVTVSDGQYTAKDTVQITMAAPGYTAGTMTPGTSVDATLPAVRTVGSYPTSSAEQVIAKFNMVPFQTLTQVTPIGVQAFHIDGVDRVRFRVNGGAWTDAIMPTYNPNTQMMEFVALLDPAKLPDGRCVVQAEAIPVAGITRPIDLTLYVNAKGSLTNKSVYVDPSSGSDSAAGTSSSPVRSIARALELVPGGGEVILNRAATYWVDRKPNRNTSLDNGRWITIKPASNLTRDQVLIAGPTLSMLRPYVDRLKWQGMKFDFYRIHQIYPESGQHVWFDNVLWTDSQGWTHKHSNHMQNVRTLAYIGGAYATNSRAYNMLYAFVDMSLVQNCTAERISGDVFQNSRMVVNCFVDTVEGGVLEHHSDLLQYFGNYENVIVNGVKFVNIKETQNFFLDHYKSSFEDMAFVNIVVQNLVNVQVATQFNSSNRHILFLNVSHPNQRVLFRNNMTSGPFVGRAMLFQNCVTTFLQADSGSVPPPGVKYVATHFTGSSGHGDSPTSGPVTIQNGTGMTFTHTGTAAGQLDRSGIPMHNFVHPNDGRDSSGLPDRGAYPILPVNVTTQPAPTEPAPTEPTPTEPAPTEPTPTEPAPSEPAPGGQDVTTGLVMHLKLDDNSTDSAGGIATKWTGTQAYTTGVSGQAARLNGSSYIATARDAKLFGQSAFSLGMWVKKSTAGEIGYPFWNHMRYGIKVEGDNLTYFLYTDAGVTLYQKATVSSLNNTNWHHVMLTYDGTKLVGYVDGVAVTTKTGLSGKVQAPSYWDPTIGSKLGLDAFAGDMDDVRAYNRALTSEQVKALATP